MATLKAVVLEHQQREDKTWNVKIRVTHNRKTAHMKTSIYVVKQQMTKNFEIKDPYIVDELAYGTTKKPRKFGKHSLPNNF